MIIVMKRGAAQSSINAVSDYIESKGLNVHISKGTELTIVGIVGDKSKITTDNLLALPDVEKIVPVSESYKLANIQFHPEETTIKINDNVSIGKNTFTVMAGPCAVESLDQLMSTAIAVKKAGATILRGGAYKPRTSPYSFQGLGIEGLKMLKAASDETGLATVTEVISTASIEAAVDYVDILQIGARNMQNFELLKEVGRTNKPVLLKRGMCATIDEWLNAAEYIMSEGNLNVILCERGIRTYGTDTRNTLDLSAVPVLREHTHLPIIIDPSHATGNYKYIKPMALAASACGADGLEIEVHNDPAHALSDGAQSLTFERFNDLMETLKPYCDLAGRKL
ncbi:3-deoxy-7-phosphoheptulonate synthase [Butyrivibrio sp. NC3005]|uniref:3-deoxy-7-phosphoheptulonate synthase n=1 Tax=Butyrivibrio sp. NC3005 TaxID=1280685 RepID=UPI00040996C8|nr:3-deoxy-7-phosphoheptulonate synthase [Butyrivibrio sp. NC3005]